MLFFDTFKPKEGSFGSNKSPKSEDDCLENLTLAWRNVSYSVERKKETNYWKGLFWRQPVEKIVLLHNVNGIASSGKLMAIMGPSGAGKTTLLATISQRIKGSPEGDVFINGRRVEKETMSRISGFVPQEDLVIQTLTVQEHMEFMACMKMDRRQRSPLRKRKIESLLAELGIERCANTKLSMLSGGERKKVSLAAQLVIEPNILFCDEPTTSLDSYGAAAVIRTLRALASRGKIVICSIHQPTSGLFNLFDEVILLSTGRVAFQGTTSGAESFFQSLGLVCPLSYNEAEFYIKQLSVCKDNITESYEKINWICNEYSLSSYATSVNERIKRVCSVEDFARVLDPSVMYEPHVQDFKKIRFLTQVEWLVWRTYIDCKRNFGTSAIRFIVFMFIGLVVSTPYIKVTENLDQASIQNVQGLLYLIVTETIFTFNYAAFNTFPKELPFLLRDIAGGLYESGPYYTSKVVFLIPGAILEVFCYTLFIYLVVGFTGGVQTFLAMVIPVILSAMSSAAFGHFISASFESIATASLFTVPIDFMGLIFSGLFLHLNTLPAGTAWLKYISQFYYGTEALSIVQWKDIRNINCPTDPLEPCISNGLDVLKSYGYRCDHYLTDCLGLLAIFVVCHFAGFLAMRFRSQKQPVY